MFTKYTRNRRISQLALFVAALPAISLAEDGLTDKSILVGQCAALKGPAMGLGTGMQSGMTAYIKQLNSKGGVHGRTIELASIDDGYEPEKTGEGTAELIEEKKVFCLAGYVGTPTGKAAVDMVQEAKVPLVGLFTGAMAFREPVKRYVLNLRASYDDETDLLVERMNKDLGVTRISVMYQNDAFGQAGLSGTEKALKKRNLTLASKGTFERNTLAVKAGLAAVMEGKPEAVIMVGPYKPLATFLQEAAASGFKSTFATISFVGTENFIQEAAAAGEGMLISQVVPSPKDATIPLVKEYQEAMKTHQPGQSLGYVSLEGFATAKLLAMGLEKAGKNLTREALVDAFEGMGSADLGGIPLVFSKSDHQGSDKVFLTEVVKGDAMPIAAIRKK
jgi:branched-chain amino acid transport system substrate-binding protein